jgi:hypothetical protein
MNEPLPTCQVFLPDPREETLDEQSASLIDNIRASMTIQGEMFRRLLESTPHPSLVLAEFLEDTGNRYIDFAELVSAAVRNKS